MDKLLHYGTTLPRRSKKHAAAGSVVLFVTGDLDSDITQNQSAIAVFYRFIPPTRCFSLTEMSLSPHRWCVHFSQIRNNFNRTSWHFFFPPKGRWKLHKQHFAWGGSRSRKDCTCRIHQFYHIKCKTDKCIRSSTTTSLRSRWKKTWLGATSHQ